MYEEIAHHRTEGPAPTVSVHEYRRDAGFGSAVLFPEEAEAWAEADSSAALAVRAAAGAPVARDDLTVLSAVDLTWHLDAALPKADRSDDGHLDWIAGPGPPCLRRPTPRDVAVPRRLAGLAGTRPGGAGRSGGTMAGP